MTSLRAASWGMLLLALACGTASDFAPSRAPLVLGGYQVLAADFHVHTFPLSAGTLTPWDTVIEARRQGLDAVAITAHDQVLSGKIGRWFSRAIGGPTVIVGEEVHGPKFHLIAAGIHSTISWRLDAVDAVRETHRQGGIAIAAHPTWQDWKAWAPALGQLDGAEVLQPTTWTSEGAARELREFYGKAPMAAIGSSDYHGSGPLGVCRTYVFARENSEQAILEAIRAHRTVVYDRGTAFGDPKLIELASGRLPEPAREGPWQRQLAAISRWCGVAALLGLVCFGGRSYRK